MNPSTLFLALLLFSLESFGEVSEYTFNSNRWQEDYQILAKQTHRKAYESLKYLPLLPNRDDIYLSLGGIFRERLNSLKPLAKSMCQPLVNMVVQAWV
jgi:hypothetical protein